MADLLLYGLIVLYLAAICCIIRNSIENDAFTVPMPKNRVLLIRNSSTYLKHATELDVITT